MRKTLLTTLLIGSFVLGGTVTYAATNYYADLLAGQQEQMENKVEEEYTKLYEEVGSKQHRDMVTLVEITRQEILEEVNDYAQDKILREANDRRQEHTEAIEKEADRILEELKEFVDNLD